MARGGTGPGGGGDGLGGGLSTDTGTTLTLEGVTVSHNFAIGAKWNGQGIGGGIYRGGVLNMDPSTIVEKNHASTSNDNFAP